MKKLLSIFLLLGIMFSCAKEENTATLPTKTLSQYKQIWKDSFAYYQNTSSEIKKSGVFDFEFTIMLDGNQKDAITQFSTLQLNDTFQSLSFKLDGSYDFQDPSNPKLEGNVKAYLNKRNFGLGDIDISFRLDNKNTLKYTLNNGNKTFLKFLLSNQNQIDTLSLFFEDNKGKELTYGVPDGVIDSLFISASETSLEDSLYKNSKLEEEKIIQSFLDSEVIDITSGTTTGNIDTLNFSFHSDHFLSFLNEVGKILGNGNENKNFDSNKELFKNITLNGILEISNNEIVNSTINSAFILNHTTFKSKIS